MWEDIKPTAELQVLYLRLKGAAERVGARRRSVAEFGITQEDISFVSGWLGVKGDAVVGWVSGNIVRPGVEASYQEMIGAVLFAAGAEAARRRANDEASVLKHFASAIPPSLRLKLLDPSFEPRSSEKRPVREAMKAALERLNLRRVVEGPGVQWWADTIKLQYGFCQKSIYSQLSNWLTGRTVPVAIQHLLGWCEVENGSEEFRLHWLSLARHRKGTLSWHGLNECLRESPWVQQESIEDYKNANLSTGINSGDVDLVDWEHELVGQKDQGRKEQDTPRPTVSVAVPETETGQGIASRVLLEWVGDGPKLCLELNTEDLRVPKWNIEGKHLTIQAIPGGKAIWRRREDGFWEGDKRIAMDPAKPPRRLAVKDSRNSTLDWENLESLGLEEEVWVFGKGGVKAESSVRVIDAGEPLFLAAPKDAELSSSGLDNSRYQKCGARKFFRVGAGWRPDMRLVIGDEVIWTPHLSDSAGSPPQPKALICPADAKEFFVAGDRVRLRALLESAGEVVNVQIGHYPARRIGTHWETDQEIEIGEKWFPGCPPLSVRVKRANAEKPKRITPQVNIPFRGLVVDRWQNDGEVTSQILKKDEELTISGWPQAGHIYVAPHSAGGLLLYEGAQPVDHIGQQGKTQLGRLLGWGESLSVGDGKEQRLFGLARAVVKCGEVALTIPSIAGGRPQLVLRTRTEPDRNDHGLHAFPIPKYDRRAGRYTNGSPQLLCVRAEHGGAVWVPTSAPNGDHWALAISYRNSWIGGWCDRNKCLDTLECLARAHGCGRQLAEMFALMLWLRFPVLHSECRKRINDIVREERRLFREAWREGKHLPEGLDYEDFDSIPGREHVCRELGII